MSLLDILLPFGLPPAEMAPDLIRALKTPSLAMLLARARLRHQAFDGFSRSLPHEAWLARQLGLPDGTQYGGSLPVADVTRRAYGMAPAAGIWFILHPVHIHVARDHLVLGDRRQLSITEAEARALFETAEILFEEAGKPLTYGDAHTWFVRADAWDGLQTSTPDTACGHNIDIWMPKGKGDREWRKLQNDVHMHWHTHPINTEREQRGLKPINSLWLWGGATDSVPRLAANPYKQCWHLPDWLQRPGEPAATIATVSAPQSQPGLLILDTLIETVLADDWPAWLARVQQLEADWFAPLLAALKAGEIERITLLASNNCALSEFTVTATSLRKFWVKPSLSRLST
jgi:hypothetical protein